MLLCILNIFEDVYVKLDYTFEDQSEFQLCTLLRGNRARRLAWTQNRLYWTDEEWFSDESRFGLHRDSRRVRIWRQFSNAKGLRCPQEVHLYQGRTAVVWAGVMVGRRTDLYFPYGFLTPKLTSKGLESDRECVGYASETFYTRYGTCEYGSTFLNYPSTALARSSSAQNTMYCSV